MSLKVGLIVCSVIVLVAVIAITLIVLWQKGVFTNEGDSVCYEGLGCFNKTAPFTGLPLPWSPEEVGIEFRLYTPEEGGESEVISTENIPKQWRNDRNTVLLVHGFNSWPTKWYNAELTDAFLNFQNEYQIITVDWEGGAKFTIPTLDRYKNAVSNSRVVGALIAQLLESISLSKDYPMSKVHCIGHSLGGHACGFAGKRLRGDLMLGRITGLDAAGPTFSDFPEEFRLNPTDANFVDGIHTHMSDGLTDWLLDGGYGIDIPVGHVDFVANGDGLQPGCSTKKKRSLIRFACSHERAVEYLTASVGSSCVFKGDPCPSMAAAKEGECRPCRPDENNCQQMGLEAVKFPGRGIFLFNTLKEPPFCDEG